MDPDPGDEVVHGFRTLDVSIYRIQSPDYTRSVFSNLSLPHNCELHLHKPIQIVN